MLELKWIVQIAACIVFCTMYGAIRALVSIKLGDKGGVAKSRLSLNPMVHIDTVGFIFMVIYNMGFIKPMRNQSIYFKNKKKSVILVSTLPLLIMLIISTSFFVMFTKNVSTAVLDSGKFVFLYNNYVVPDYVTLFIASFIKISICTSIYNLIPIYPLECEKILNYFVSPNTRLTLSQYDKVLQMGLVLLTITKFLPAFVEIITYYYISFIHILFFA